MDQLAHRLRSARQQRGLSINELARRSGISKAYICMIERDQLNQPPREPILQTLERTLALEGQPLIEAAQWRRTPPQVQQRLAQLQQQQHAQSQHAQQLLQRARTHGGLDAMFANGDLQDWLERMSSNIEPMTADTSTQVPLINKVAAGYPTDFTDLDYPARIADEYVACPGLNDETAFAARVVGQSMLPRYREGDIVIFSPMRQVTDGADCFVRLLPDHESTFKRIVFIDSKQVRLQPLNPKFPARVVPREQIDGMYPAVMRIEQIAQAEAPT